MCRKNVIRGWLLIAFGAGALLGTLVGNDFFVFLVGLAAVIWGFCLQQK